MQHAQSREPIASIEDLGAVERLVTQSLFGDWIIQIEHSSLAYRRDGVWSRWGKGFFGARDVTGLIDAILTCRSIHPTHAIRMHSEKLRPRSRLVYWVFRPQGQTMAPIRTATTSFFMDSPRRLAVALGK
jgi:ribulose bisphosphate carboxylase small subunit